MERPTLTPDAVLRLARLARLTVEESELGRLSADLEKILGYVQMLESVDTSSVEPTAHVMLARAPQRADEAGASLDHDVALAEAPKTSGEGFAVPAFVEE